MPNIDFSFNISLYVFAKYGHNKSNKDDTSISTEAQKHYGWTNRQLFEQIIIKKYIKSFTFYE